MADEDQTQVEASAVEAEADPWAAAFASLDKVDEEAPEAAAVAEPGDERDVPNADEADDGEGAAPAEGGDGAEPAQEPGGPGDLGGDDSPENVGLDWDDIDVSEESAKQYREGLIEDIKERTIRDVAAAYIKQGARNVKGRLGATINDPDVCKRDEGDGVPHFYNPETGREFTGDNPRRQAQEWVDDYNRELSEAFNRTCQDYSQKLLEQEGGRLAVIEFAPKYKALDPMRRSMFESIIEDYEVTDADGNVVSYSCDLNKALAAVNRQVQAIQRQYANHKSKVPEDKEPTGPALDTPSTTGGKANNGKPQFKSIEEAMEWEQDQLLAKMKGGK